MMGMDAFVAIHHWHHWQQLLDFAHIVVSQRPETQFCDESQWPGAVRALYQHHKAERHKLAETLCGKIRLEPVTQLAISATDIRKRLKNKQSIRFLVPDPVINLIKYYNLYE